MWTGDDPGDNQPLAPGAVAHLLSWKAFTRIDFVGGATLFCSSAFLVFSIQQAGSQTFDWNSPEIISTFVLSGVSWILFVGWEIHLDNKRFGNVEPIFPMRLMTRRVYVAGWL